MSKEKKEPKEQSKQSSEKPKKKSEKKEDLKTSEQTEVEIGYGTKDKGRGVPEPAIKVCTEELNELVIEKLVDHGTHLKLISKGNVSLNVSPEFAALYKVRKGTVILVNATILTVRQTAGAIEAQEEKLEDK